MGKKLAPKRGTAQRRQIVHRLYAYVWGKTKGNKRRGTPSGRPMLIMKHYPAKEI